MLNKPKMQGKFDESKLPAHPAVPRELLAKMTIVDNRGLKCLRAEGTAAEQVKTMCELMLAYNTIDSTSDNPEDLQGVFWMDGNGIPEELACLNYAETTSYDGSTVLNR